MSCQPTLTWTSGVFQSATSSSWQQKAQPIGTSSDQPRLLSKGLHLEVRVCWDEECGRSDGRLEGVTDRFGVFEERSELMVPAIYDNSVALSGITLELWAVVCISRKKAMEY